MMLFTAPGADEPRMQRRPPIVPTILVVVGVALIAVAAYLLGGMRSGGGDLSSDVSGETSHEQSGRTLYYPTDKLFVTKDRKDYRAGDIILSVPRLNFEGPVLADVEDETLKGGVGLYDYSPLPSPTRAVNANVSIAGHRDLHGNEFYYIDTITEGDLLYLTYGGNVYAYEYEWTKIIEPSDWSVIHCTDYPCLTLTSCDPIGIANKRIIVRARLLSVEVGEEQVSVAAPPEEPAAGEEAAQAE